MTPNYYVCTCCGEQFNFKFHHACYYIGQAPVSTQVNDRDLLAIPTRPAWCKACNHLTLAEDIEALRTFEHLYGVVKKGQSIEYPFASECLDYEDAVDTMAKYLRWRMTRRHAARALCCGTLNYQLMDVAQPLLKHAECDFGSIEGICVLSSYCGPGPGAYTPANYPLCTTEGEPIGVLTWRKFEEGKWQDAKWDVALFAAKEVKLVAHNTDDEDSQSVIRSLTQRDM